MIILTLAELKNDMENGACYENSFLYNGVDYYLMHDFENDKYYFGICDSKDDMTFDSFDEVMGAKLFSDKTFKEILPELQWYCWMNLWNKLIISIFAIYKSVSWLCRSIRVDKEARSIQWLERLLF